MDLDFIKYAKFIGLGLAAVTAAMLGLAVSNMKEEEDKAAKNMTITSIVLLGIYALTQGYLIIDQTPASSMASLVLLGGCMLQIIALSLLGASIPYVDTSIKGFYVVSMIIIGANVLMSIVQSGDYMCDSWFARRTFA